MGTCYTSWKGRSPLIPQSFEDVNQILLSNRNFVPAVELRYGDHGLQAALDAVRSALHAGKRIALYADYDVDGTMSCVSWIWFLQAIGYHNFVHYIPCRFREGYGLNMDAIAHLIDEEKAEVIITMDTGITANAEAAYCKERGVTFICTDHHTIQEDKMPDSIILNPKQHPDPAYQELCGCGITYVLLRQLGKSFKVEVEVWNDILAITGMATICDVVPLNPINHQLARLGVRALLRSNRPVIGQLRQACALLEGLNETDVGFRLGPRINAVGRLEHADAVIKAFTGEDTSALVRHMAECNERRKLLQRQIVKEARQAAERQPKSPILFLGGDWHPGVVGIAASKLVEEFWRPVWLFQRGDDQCKGSSRSIAGFDVTGAMGSASELFTKFGGHHAAGGYSFAPGNEEAIHQALVRHAEEVRSAKPELWKSRMEFDCELPVHLLQLDLMDHLDNLRPFGHGFSEPRFVIEASIYNVRFYQDKVTGEPQHTAVVLDLPTGKQKLMFFNAVHRELVDADSARFIVTAQRNAFRGEISLSLIGSDYELVG